MAKPLMYQALVDSGAASVEDAARMEEVRSAVKWRINAEIFADGDKVASAFGALDGAVLALAEIFGREATDTILQHYADVAGGRK